MQATCPECKAKISHEAHPCPKCGKKMAGPLSTELSKYVKGKILDKWHHRCFDCDEATGLKISNIASIRESPPRIRLDFEGTCIQCGSSHRTGVSLQDIIHAVH